MLKGAIADCGNTMPADTWMLMLHGTATTHKGHFRPKGADKDTYFHFDDSGAPLELKLWRTQRRISEADVPARWMSKHPKDQGMLNSLTCSKHDQTIARLGSTDFGEDPGKTAADALLSAFAITIRLIAQAAELLLG